MSKSKIIGLYERVSDIGNHELSYLKVGNFDSGNLVVVVRSVVGVGARVMYDNKEIMLDSGMILGKDAVIDTGRARVELIDSKGSIYRLGYRSQFCIETTV